MGVKEESRTSDRVSVTQRPTTVELLNEMSGSTHITKSDLFNVGIDVLHFVWSVLRKDGVIGVKFPGDSEYKPVNILIPGMTKRSIDVG